MMQYHLAIDIGASGGRHILGWVEEGRLQLQEVYRFDNGFATENGSLVWDVERLFQEVKAGLRACAAMGKIPATVGFDTWGVDYVLLDEAEREILPCYCYRDSRTRGAVEAVERRISREELYAHTGIQKQEFNTVYQLYADRTAGRLERAKHFLMMPCYLAWRLTGVMKNEYTLCSTTGLLRAETRAWDEELLARLEIPASLLGEISPPCTAVGQLREAIRQELGFDCTVVLSPCHDTASAVAACPMAEDDLYISSGTWSLIGRECREPILSEAACRANFTNEGGVEYRIRFLKNYMGMWLFQNIRRDLNRSMTYDEMMELAKGEREFTLLDVNHPSFVAPENMIEAIRAYCGQPDLPLAQVLASVYHSLAQSYKTVVEELETITGREVPAIHIVGGGCKDSYLNDLATQYTGKPVTAGPVEATAVGNLLSQLIYAGTCRDLGEARALVARSFVIG